jgi:hypothetical protein
VVDEIAYDCSSWVDKHPGGDSMIQSFGIRIARCSFGTSTIRKDMAEYGQALRIESRCQLIVIASSPSRSSIQNRHQFPIQDHHQVPPSPEHHLVQHYSPASSPSPIAALWHQRHLCHSRQPSTRPLLDLNIAFSPFVFAAMADWRIMLVC